MRRGGAVLACGSFCSSLIICNSFASLTKLCPLQLSCISFAVTLQRKSEINNYDKWKNCIIIMSIITMSIMIITDTMTIAAATVMTITIIIITARAISVSCCCASLWRRCLLQLSP